MLDGKYSGILIQGVKTKRTNLIKNKYCADRQIYSHTSRKVKIVVTGAGLEGDSTGFVVVTYFIRATCPLTFRQPSLHKK